MKKRRYEKGSILLESIVALSTISLVILTLLPFQTNMQHLLLSRKNEVEAWRFAQDYMRQKVVEKQTTVSGQRTSDGSHLVASWNEKGSILTVTNHNQEVINFEYISSQ